MKQTKRLMSLAAAVLVAISSWAQMEFTYSAAATESTMTDGSTLVQFAGGTDLNGGIITGVKVGGQTVQASAITPDPTKTFITDGEIETFVYDGKAYSFRFIAGEYFTAVFFSDPHVDTESIKNTLANQVANMVNMNKPGGKVVTFSKAPKGYVATTDIAFCLGDMDEDKEEDASSPGQYYKDATAAFNTAGIPFISLLGNHDLAPDYWTGENGGIGLSYGSTGGSGYNDKSIAIVEEHLTQAQTNGISDVNVFTDLDLSCDVQIEPFAFKFKGVRFYVGHTYWFQKPYDKPSLISNAKYYAPDGVIEALDAYVNEHKDEASIWMQHYPFVSEADTKNSRWWLDQNDVGKCIMPSDANSSAYYNNATDVKYDSEEGIALAKKKRDALATIINKTKNPVHFSGHVHKYDEQTYQGIKDYSVAQPGNAFVVLCKEGVGVVEVQRVTF